MIRFDFCRNQRACRDFLAIIGPFVGFRIWWCINTVGLIIQVWGKTPPTPRVCVAYQAHWKLNHRDLLGAYTTIRDRLSTTGLTKEVENSSLTRKTSEDGYLSLTSIKCTTDSSRKSNWLGQSPPFFFLKFSETFLHSVVHHPKEDDSFYHKVCLVFRPISIFVNFYVIKVENRGKWACRQLCHSA